MHSIEKKFDQSIKEAVLVLHQKGSILYPTETVWGIGCDATDTEAVAKIYKIKERSREKSLIVLVSDINMLNAYVGALNKRILKTIISYPKPLTIIYPNVKNLAENVYNKDGTVAIRLIKHAFCKTLISEFAKPIVSTSANISGYPTPKSFNSVSSYILNRVDYVVNLQFSEGSGISSTIARITDNDEITIVRP
jgi:L-threonylcarbamoyladenylate synthase